MKISTKGRYSLLVMIDLTENQSDDFIPLRDIAKRQDISEKYLESIIKLLVKNKLLVGLRGKGGGYKLTKRPSDITVGEVLRIAEENIMIDEEDTDSMYRTSEYRTIDMWSIHCGFDSGRSGKRLYHLKKRFYPIHCIR